jgi:hypothetical protein
MLFGGVAAPASHSAAHRLAFIVVVSIVTRAILQGAN